MLLCVGLALSVVSAAPTARDLLTQAAPLVRAQEPGALKLLQRAKTLAADDPVVLAQVHLLLGVAFGQQGDEAGARRHFRTALLLDGRLQLPWRLPPRIVEWWKQSGGLVPPAPSEPAPVELTPPPPPPVAPPVIEPTPPPAVVQPAVVPAPASPRWFLVPGGVTALSGVGAGIAFSIAAGRYDALLRTGQFQEPADVTGAVNQGRGWQTAGWACAAVATAALISAIVVWVFELQPHTTN
jgi:hypothetical protein